MLNYNNGYNITSNNGTIYFRKKVALLNPIYYVQYDDYIFVVEESGYVFVVIIGDENYNICKFDLLYDNYGVAETRINNIKSACVLKNNNKYGIYIFKQNHGGNTCIYKLVFNPNTGCMTYKTKHNLGKINDYKVMQNYFVISQSDGNLLLLNDRLHDMTINNPTEFSFDEIKEFSVEINNTVTINL